MKHRIQMLSMLLTFVLAFPGILSAQNWRPGGKEITGTVVDSKTGEPLIGAVVLVSGHAAVHALTDIDGRFRIKMPQTAAGLEVSLMGYQTLNVEVTSQDMRLRLLPDVQMLDEVQVIAYGKQSKMSVTGAITSISSEDILKSPSGSAASALAGAVTGLSSIQTSGQLAALDSRRWYREIVQPDGP